MTANEIIIGVAAAVTLWQLAYWFGYGLAALAWKVSELLGE